MSPFEQAMAEIERLQAQWAEEDRHMHRKWARRWSALVVFWALLLVWDVTIAVFSDGVYRALDIALAAVAALVGAWCFHKARRHRSGRW